MGRLHDAAASGNVEEVEQCIEEGEDLDSIKRDSRGEDTSILKTKTECVEL